MSRSPRYGSGIQRVAFELLRDRIEGGKNWSRNTDIRKLNHPLLLTPWVSLCYGYWASVFSSRKWGSSGLFISNSPWYQLSKSQSFLSWEPWEDQGFGGCYPRCWNHLCHPPCPMVSGLWFCQNLFKVCSSIASKEMSLFSKAIF